MAKTILITGAAKRLGAACAEHLHALGWNVILQYAHSASQAQALSLHLNQVRPDSAAIFAAELSDMQQLQALADYAAARWGGLNALLNNAAAFRPCAVELVDAEHWAQMFDVNLKAPFFLIQAVLPYLRAAENACVVNMADIHAESGLSGYSVYSASKAGLVNLTRCLAKELAPQIRVNAIAPGAILWPEQEADELRRQDILQRIPLQRSGRVEDIAMAVGFLLEQADYMTGQVLAVDGGRSLNR
jgi:pteridine reductase